jgi:hypothetical protein
MNRSDGRHDSSKIRRFVQYTAVQNKRLVMLEQKHYELFYRIWFRHKACDIDK